MVIHGMAIAFAQCKMAHAVSAAVYGLPVAAFEIMPAWQGFTLVAQAIGTAFRQPAELVARQIAQIDAIFDFLLAARKAYTRMSRLIGRIRRSAPDFAELIVRKSCEICRRS